MTMNESNFSAPFHYEEAFSRNIGLLTEAEQQKLREFTIAIPGMGGVGGAHFISLVRQGFERFKIADIDAFEMKNMNRQYGSRPDTAGRQKVEVMKEEALKINPNCQIEVYEHGVTKENVEQFLEGVDAAVDAIDIFEVETYRTFFNTAHAKKIPVVFAAPIGFSTAFLIFTPEGPSFDEYFDVNDDTPYRTKLVHFLMGLLPSMLQQTYMTESNVDLERRSGPSSIGSVNLCAGVVTINILKLLLKRGEVKSVPYYHQFDAMRNKYVVKRLWFGNRNPIQRLKMYVAERKYFS